MSQSGHAGALEGRLSAVRTDACRAVEGCAVRADILDVQRPRLNEARRYEAWEWFIDRLQAAVMCSDVCPVAGHLLGVVEALAEERNPLAEVFPELDPRSGLQRRP